MAITPISTQYSLLRVRSDIRTLINQPGPQNGLLDVELNDIIHNATLAAKTAFREAIANQYMTEETVTEAGNVIDISSFSIADVGTVKFKDSSFGGDVPVVSDEMLETLRKLYSAATPTDLLVCAVLNIGGVSAIRTLRGSGYSTPGTLTFKYERNPKRPASDGVMLDVPDSIVPAVIAATVFHINTGKPVDNYFGAGKNASA